MINAIIGLTSDDSDARGVRRSIYATLSLTLSLSYLFSVPDNAITSSLNIDSADSVTYIGAFIKICSGMLIYLAIVMALIFFEGLSKVKYRREDYFSGLSDSDKDVVRKVSAEITDIISFKGPNGKAKIDEYSIRIDHLNNNLKKFTTAVPNSIESALEKISSERNSYRLMLAQQPTPQIAMSAYAEKTEYLDTPIILRIANGEIAERSPLLEYNEEDAAKDIDMLRSIFIEIRTLKSANRIISEENIEKLIETYDSDAMRVISETKSIKENISLINREMIKGYESISNEIKKVASDIAALSSTPIGKALRVRSPALEWIGVHSGNARQVALGIVVPSLLALAAGVSFLVFPQAAHKFVLLGATWVGFPNN